MNPPPTLLRDAALASCAVIAGACAWDVPFGLAVAAGALAGLANLAGWVLAVRGILRGGMAYGFLAAKVLSGTILLLGLGTIVPALPLVVGFMAPLGGIMARGFVGIPSLWKPA